MWEREEEEKCWEGDGDLGGNARNEEVENNGRKREEEGKVRGGEEEKERGREWVVTKGSGRKGRSSDKEKRKEEGKRRGKKGRTGDEGKWKVRGG